MFIAKNLDSFHRSGPFETVSYAVMEPLAQPVDADFQRVIRDLMFLGESLARGDLGGSLVTIVDRKHLPVIRVQLFQTTVQAAESNLSDFRRFWWRRQGDKWWPLGMLKKNSIRDAVEEVGRITDVTVDQFRELSCHAIEGLISELFGLQAAASRKYPDQPAPDFLVFSSGCVGAFAIWVKP